MWAVLKHGHVQYYMDVVKYLLGHVVYKAGSIPIGTRKSRDGANPALCIDD